MGTGPDIPSTSSLLQASVLVMRRAVLRLTENSGNGGRFAGSDLQVDGQAAVTYGSAPFSAGGWSPFEPKHGAAVGAGSPDGCSGENQMNKAQLKKFKVQLEEKRDEIVKKAKQTLNEDMLLDTADLPDEMDLASSEYLQSLTFRLRGREKQFLDKIQKALVKIEDGSFGKCDACEEEISQKRLEARPETNLCIRCKEDQERAEKDFG
jgi:RNA polymerase-binding transcription factor